MFSLRSNWNLQPNRWARAVDELRGAGKLENLLDLSASNPTTVGFDFDSQAILRALADPASLEYQPQPRGLLRAREAVSEYYAQHQTASPVAADDVLLTASTSEAYSFLFRLLCNPGDEVLVAAPSYPLFEYLAGINDVAVRHYRLFYDHGWQMDMHSLEKAITSKTRAIIVVHPNNPTGSFIRATEAVRLNEICAERKLAIIADEVFLDYPHADERLLSFAGNRAALTFTLSGISKICALPQLKLAWMVISGPQELASAASERLELIADTYLSVNSAVQNAAAQLCTHTRGVRGQIMERIRQNLSELDRQLVVQKECSRLQIDAGWYAVLRIPALHSDEDVAIELLQHSVLAHPGHFYDFGAEGFLVLSLITPKSVFAEGLRRIFACVRAL